jgi:hypothetical protein
MGPTYLLLHHSIQYVLLPAHFTATLTPLNFEVRHVEISRPGVLNCVDGDLGTSCISKAGAEGNDRLTATGLDDCRCGLRFVMTPLADGLPGSEPIMVRLAAAARPRQDRQPNGLCNRTSTGTTSLSHPQGDDSELLLVTH